MPPRVQCDFITTYVHRRPSSQAARRHGWADTAMTMASSILEVHDVIMIASYLSIIAKSLLHKINAYNHAKLDKLATRSNPNLDPNLLTSCAGIVTPHCVADQNPMWQNMANTNAIATKPGGRHEAVVGLHLSKFHADWTICHRCVA